MDIHSPTTSRGSGAGARSARRSSASRRRPQARAHRPDPRRRPGRIRARRRAGSSSPVRAAAMAIASRGTWRANKAAVRPVARSSRSPGNPSRRVRRQSCRARSRPAGDRCRLRFPSLPRRPARSRRGRIRRRFAGRRARSRPPFPSRMAVMVMTWAGGSSIPRNRFPWQRHGLARSEPSHPKPYPRGRREPVELRAGSRERRPQRSGRAARSGSSTRGLPEA
jgi:hypothetical protein